MSIMDGPDTGIELMLWADEGWFDDETRQTDFPDPSEGHDPLGEFADDILDTVAECLDADHTPTFEFVQNAPPSLVFSANFYLD